MMQKVLKDFCCVLTESLHGSWENQEIAFYLLSHPSSVSENLGWRRRQVELAPGRAKTQDKDLGVLVLN